MLKQLAAWLFVVVLMAAIVGGLGYFKFREIQAAIAAGAAFPEPVEAVGSAVTRKGSWSPTTRAIGTVVALRQVEIRNEIAGVVSEVGFRSGEMVKAGQLLIKLDTRLEEASLAAAEAEARLAKTTLDRRQSLRNSPAFSEQELDRAREEYAAADARAKSLAVAIERKSIFAPFDGQVGITDLQPGTYLDVGSRITTVQGVNNDSFVDFSLPQDSAAMVHKGTQVTLSSMAMPGAKAVAEIVAEDNGVDRNNRTVLFRAVARGLGGLLRPGMFLDVTTATAPPQEAIVVPLTALRRSAAGAHVFVLVEEDGKLRARERRIEIGPVLDRDIVVFEGLELGERIATTGSFKLREGVLVQPEANAADTGNATVN